MAVPFVHAPDLPRAVPQDLSPRITRIIAENPGPFTYTGSGTYLLSGGGGTVVIDPGPDDPDHVERIAIHAPQAVDAILVTHTHRDHCGGARRLGALTGAPVYAFGPHPSAPGEGAPALDEGGDHSFAPDRQLADGEILRIGGLTLRALHTPGHISNHLCFALEEEKALFTGDHIMGWATTVVAPPDGDMDAYMASLDLLLERQDEIYYPTHGAPIEEPRAFVEAVKAHRLERDRAVVAVLNEGAASVPEIVERVYRGLSPALVVAAGLNVEAHLRSHQHRGRVRRLGDGRYALAAEPP